MRTVRSTITLLLAFLLTAALCGCAASSPGESPGSAPAKPVDATDFMSNAGPVFPLTLAQAEPALFCRSGVAAGLRTLCRREYCRDHSDRPVHDPQ